MKREELDVEQARKLYEEFWKLYPDIKNPSDINCPEKAFFMVLKGFEAIKLMQAARKQGLEFTKRP